MMKPLFMSFLAVLCTFCSANTQPLFLAEQQSALESRNYRYDTHWVCTGDTLETYSNDEDTFTLVDGFWITCYEVSQDLFEWYMNYNPSVTKGELYPITNINTDEALSFCEKLSETTHAKWTIPTAEQWWFAHNGGLFSEGYRYAGSNRLNLVAWTAANSGGILHVGGQRISNELGLYDMDGNVAEMVSSGDSISFAGGCYLSDMSAFDGKQMYTVPPECRGLRIVCHKPLWFNSYGEIVFDNTILNLKN